jgi:hypothetical protein
MGLDLEANPNPILPHLLLLRSELTAGAGDAWQPGWTDVLMRDETRMTAHGTEDGRVEDSVYQARPRIIAPMISSR